MTQSLISNEPSGLFDMFGTNEQTVASPDPTEQLSGLVQGGTQTDNPSAPQPTTETTVASIETSAIQGTGLDSAMNKLVDINDIFGKKEEQPTLSMKPLEGPEKDKSPTNGLRSSITFAGPQPTLAQMKTVKTVRTTSEIYWSNYLIIGQLLFNFSPEFVLLPIKIQLPHKCVHKRVLC
mmetsp:Transcript_69104/g.102709  ORF Transcript_69104/g.102709 Transcript_69104/m.102709 type:complete len:179 (+) Transcript_69104:507-1043(+)